MKIVGLHGLPRCGKDTIGDILAARHGFARYAFATPIKDMLMAGLGLARHEVDAPDKEAVVARLGATPRFLLQSLGTGWGREMVRPDLWIDVAHARTEFFRRSQIPIVFTDVRFENEARWVRSLGGALWHVQRPRSGNVVNLHPSNAVLPILVGEDSVLVNDLGLDQLPELVGRALRGELVVTGGGTA